VGSSWKLTVISSRPSGTGVVAGIGTQGFTLGSFENGVKAVDASAGEDARTTAGLETGATGGVAIFMPGCETKDHERLFSASPSGGRILALCAD
jgi:hypothetical protein